MKIVVDEWALRRILAESGLTQSKLAELSGVSRNTIGAYLRRGDFDSRHLSALLTALNHRRRALGLPVVLPWRLLRVEGFWDRGMA